MPNSDPEQAPLWTLQDVATHLRCTVRHVQNLIGRGLPCLRIGKLVRFDPAEVKSFLRARRDVPGRGNPGPTGKQADTCDRL